MPWRSPADQPAWARPALLAIAGVAAVAYGWGMAGASVEPYYGAAARSRSENWHDFIFGAFDPAGTVTVDKLPGALWAQALSRPAAGATASSPAAALTPVGAVHLSRPSVKGDGTTQLPAQPAAGWPSPAGEAQPAATPENRTPDVIRQRFAVFA
jgi:hypothetical protein